MEFAPRETLAGQLLRDLERRQDEVLAELERLDAAVEQVLRAWGGRPVEEAAAPVLLPFSTEEEDDEAEPNQWRAA
jgi:hypothetical protein